MVDPNAPQDPYLAEQQYQPAQPVYDPAYAQPVQPPSGMDPMSAPVEPLPPQPDFQPVVEPLPAQPEVQPIVEPVQSSELNQYNTPQLSAQIQMAQQAGAQANQAQTVSAQMMAQNQPAQPNPPVQPAAEPGEPAPQVYKPPLVIGNSVARAFAYLAILTIVVAVINFIVNQFKGQFASSEIYSTIVTILQRINTVTLFARIACIGFAVVATVVRVYNPHPYNTKNAIAAWVFSLLSLLALLIFK